MQVSVSIDVMARTENCSPIMAVLSLLNMLPVDIPHIVVMTNTETSSDAFGESSYRKPQTAEADGAFVVATTRLPNFGYGTPTLADVSYVETVGASPAIVNIVTIRRHGNRVTKTCLLLSPVVFPSLRSRGSVVCLPLATVVSLAL